MKNASRTIFSLGSICIGLVLGLNVGFIMELLECSFTGLATIFITILIFAEFFRSNRRRQQYWSFFYELLLAILLGICVNEFYDSSALKIVGLDTFTIIVAIVVVLVYQLTMKAKIEKEERNQQTAAEEERRKRELEQQAAVEEEKKRRENAKVYDWAEDEESEPKTESEEVPPPSPEVVENILRNLTERENELNL